MTKGGGWKGVTLAALQVVGLGALYAWSVLIEPVQAFFEVGRTATGLVFSVSMAVFTLAVMATPRLCAGWRLSSMGAIACLTGAAGLAGAAMAPTFPIFMLAYGGLFAAASGLGYSAGLQVAVASGVARTGLATGVIVASFAAGAVILGPLMGAVAASGCIASALFLPAIFLLGVSGLSFGAQRVYRTFDGCFPAREVNANQHMEESTGNLLIGLLWCGFATGSAGGLMILGHAAGIVIKQGGSVMLAGVAVSMIAIGNAVGRILSGSIADQLGPRTVVMFAALLLGLATGAMVLDFNVVTTVAALALVGFSYGLMATGYPVAVHHFFGSDRFGPVYGHVFTAWGVAGLVAPFAAGWLFDRTGDYRLALQIATASAVVSAIIAFLLPRKDRRADEPIA